MAETAKKISMIPAKVQYDRKCETVREENEGRCLPPCQYGTGRAGQQL